MDKLPLEMLLEICSYCNITSLREVRLVSSALASAATPWLFEEVLVAFFPKSLENLRSIAFHPVISKYVKSLIYLGEMLEGYTTIEDWEKQIDHRPGQHIWMLANHPEYYDLQRPEPWQTQGRLFRREYREIPRHTLSSEQQMYHFMRYQYYLNQQYWLYYTSFNFELLRTSFVRLNNLEKIQLSSGISNNITQPIWRRLKTEILVVPDEHRAGRRPARPHTNGVPQLLGIIGACELSHMPIKTLDVGLIAPEFWSQFSAMDDRAHESTGLRLMYLFEHLQSLVLDLNYDASEIDETRTSVRTLGKVIGRAKQVEKLHIRVREGAIDPDLPFDFLEFVPEEPFSMLRDLKVSLPTRERSLMRLLKTNSATLRSLSLIDAELLIDNGGSWRSVIQQLPQVLTLQKVYLKCLCDLEFGNGFSYEKRLLVDRNEPATQYERAIDHYVLHGGTFPTLEPPNNSAS